MYKRQTYGERMSRFEEEKDLADWKRRLSKAIEEEDIAYSKELMKEGKCFGYELPNVSSDNVEIQGYIVQYRK